MMKKLFTGASAALAGLLLASPAAAQGETESMMSLGGYSNYTVSFTKHPEGQIAEQEGDIDIFNDTEIFFNGSAETDGGLQVSARVELEGHSENDQIDEHYITVSGGFGSVEVGANDGADERTATGVHYNNSAVDYIYWNDITVPTHGYRGVGLYSDGMGVTYTTPNLGGVTLAVGYKPSRESGSRRGAVQSGDENVLTFGANYHGEADGISFTGSFGYGTHELADVAGTATTYGLDVPDVVTAAAISGGLPTVTAGTVTNTVAVTQGVAAATERSYKITGLGAKLGFGDTSLYARWENNETEADGETTRENDQFSVAIAHSIGPVKLSLGWVQDTTTRPNNGRRLVDGTTGVPLAVGTATTTAEELPGTGEQENENSMLLGAVDYALGSGVVVTAYAAWGETEQSGATHDEDDLITTEITGVSAATTDIGEGTTGPAKDEAASEDATAFGVALTLAF